VEEPYAGWTEQMQACAPTVAQALLPFPQYCGPLAGLLLSRVGKGLLDNPVLVAENVFSSSKLVEQDVRGDKISGVIRNGRPEKGMPRFNLSDQDIVALVTFIHHERDEAEAHPGARRRVDVSDLQTGNSEAGKQYFNGAGMCSSCHSPTGDLAGIAKRYQGLKLEERMLYPEKARARILVTLPSGERISGTLAYRDEFTVGMNDAEGWYHSWPADEITCSTEEPAEAHVRLLGKYTDTDIHNLMAYLQTLR
jgi:cytochrome c oxidase cbb3-type subunit III